MKWIEMIRVRSSSDSQKNGNAAVVAQMESIRNAPGMVDTMLLRHALFNGDMAVVLVWDNERQPVQTREGLTLAESLQRHGMVDHAVWVAQPGFEAASVRSKTRATTRMRNS